MVRAVLKSGHLYRHLKIFKDLFFLKISDFFFVITATTGHSCLASLPAGLRGLPAPAVHP